MAMREHGNPGAADSSINPACVHPFAVFGVHMGIAMLAATRLMQIVPVWVEGWEARVAAGRMVRRLLRARHNPSASPAMARTIRRVIARVAKRHGLTSVPCSARVDGHAPRPRTLRVLRVIEPQQPRESAGRMVISGRMADVCAELDRLAAAEAATRP
jgi:hypothetical protein